MFFLCWKSSDFICDYAVVTRVATGMLSEVVLAVVVVVTVVVAIIIWVVIVVFAALISCVLLFLLVIGSPGAGIDGDIF